MRIISHHYLLTAVSVILLCAGCTRKLEKRTVGTIHSIHGKVTFFDTTTRAWRTMTAATHVCSGDSIRTAKNAKIEIAIADSSSISLDESTTMQIVDTVDSIGNRALIARNAGGEIMADLHGLSQAGIRFSITTPTAVADAEGTHFLVFFDPVPRITRVNVLHGRVRVFNPFAPMAVPVILVPGFFTTVSYLADPLPPVALNYGQFKKMNRILGPRQYSLYAKKFKVGPRMALNAPLVPFLPPIIVPGAKPGKLYPVSPFTPFSRKRMGARTPLPPPIIHPAPGKNHKGQTKAGKNKDNEKEKKNKVH